jgi:hypothetical protein
MSKPTAAHWNAAKVVLRYLIGTAQFGITYGGSDFSLVGYCDADYAGDLATRRSTSGFAFVIARGVVSWSARLQATVAVSTAEAEYMAAAAAVKEAMWLRTLMNDLGVPVSGGVHIFTDNQASLTLLKNPISSQRSKHIDIIYHFARECVTRGLVDFSYISTDDMAADIMTKALPLPKFKTCRDLLGIA